jgi:hypothetical protein
LMKLLDECVELHVDDHGLLHQPRPFGFKHLWNQMCARICARDAQECRETRETPRP